MNLTVGGTELALDNSGLVRVHKSHDLNSKARHIRDDTALFSHRNLLVWLVGNADISTRLAEGSGLPVMRKN
jgi:hypothetical protein